MLVKDFENNPKRIAMLINTYEALQELLEQSEVASNWDYENNNGKGRISLVKLEIEKDYPNDSWSRLEFAIESDENEFKTVKSIPWGTGGVLRVYDSAGKYTEWWI